VYGRICDCVQACARSAPAVLNTALGCAANLANTLVVSNRATAVAVLDHLHATKAGCLKCLIVEEAPPKVGQPPLPASLQSQKAQPIANQIQAQPGCDAALPVVQSLLKSWVQVPSWDAAEAFARAQRSSSSRFGIVTECACCQVAVVMGAWQYAAWYDLKHSMARGWSVTGQCELVLATVHVQRRPV
jgi:chromosome segregation ATPase